VNLQKRIAVFLPALYGGGAERTMLNLTQGMAEQGHAVDLVLAQAEGPYMEDIPKSIRLIDLGQGRTVNKARTMARLPSLVRYLRDEQPDAMLSALSRANFAALWARRLAGTPKRVVINEQNTYTQEALNSPNLIYRLSPHMAKYLYRWADSVVGVSQGVVDDLVQVVGIPPELAKVIYNPGVTPELREKAQGSTDHPWFQPGEPPVLLGVGRLTKQKDFFTLIKAFARLRQSRPARLLILGEGPERQMLEALIQQLDLGQDVSLPGFVENPFAYMKRASAFVLSSLWEGLPTVLMEALYCGVPIVATDCPSGPREILKNGENGRLVPVGDHVALSDALVALLDGEVPPPSPESWQPFTLETIVGQYIDLLLGDQKSADRHNGSH
jgi:glycosyltransferase involved in cell wall biosynthesis